jgi:hypothetical protein
MSNLIVSMLRFSAAMTLYNFEQFEKTLSVLEGGADAGKTLEGFEKALNAMTDVLTNEMDEQKKQTLQSVTKMTEETVNRSLEGMEIMDPKQVLQATTDLLQKTSDVTAQWVSKAASAVEKATGPAKSPEDGSGEPSSQGAVH